MPKSVYSASNYMKSEVHVPRDRNQTMRRGYTEYRTAKSISDDITNKSRQGRAPYLRTRNLIGQRKGDSWFKGRMKQQCTRNVPARQMYTEDQVHPKSRDVVNTISGGVEEFPHSQEKQLRFVETVQEVQKSDIVSSRFPTVNLPPVVIISESFVDSNREGDAIAKVSEHDLHIAVQLALHHN